MTRSMSASTTHSTSYPKSMRSCSRARTPPPFSIRCGWTASIANSLPPRQQSRWSWSFAARAAGALAAVLPLLRVRRGPMRTIEFADLRVSDYLSPVCAATTFADLLQDRHACERLRRLLRPFDLLRVPKLLDARMPIENLLGAPHRSLMDTNAYAHGPGRAVRAMADQRLGTVLSEGAGEEMAPDPQEGRTQLLMLRRQRLDRRGHGDDEEVSRPTVSGPGRRRPAAAPGVLSISIRTWRFAASAPLSGSTP